MERIRNSGNYQKAIMLIVLVMAIFFAIVYTVVISRVGLLYQDHIFISHTQNGNTVYSGTIHGQDCSFSITPDKVVSFRCGPKFYGPYTATEDPSAIPAEYLLSANSVGIELRENDKLLFRGAMLTHEPSGFLLLDENGELHGFGVVVTMSDGSQVDENGHPVDPWKPSVHTLLELMHGPELTHKGHWGFWFLGLFLCAVTVVSILFADELFRLSMCFRVYNPDLVEPSDWEIAGRYISWTIMPIMTLIVFVLGLQ